MRPRKRENIFNTGSQSINVENFWNSENNLPMYSLDGVERTAYLIDDESGLYSID